MVNKIRSDLTKDPVNFRSRGRSICYTDTISVELIRAICIFRRGYIVITFNLHPHRVKPVHIFEQGQSCISFDY